MASKPPLGDLRDEEKTHQYVDKLPTDISLARKVLEGYSGIAPAEVIPHILATHAKALTHPDAYPCLTSFRYLQFHISIHPLYTHLLSRLTSPTSSTNLLDVGTCMGQDLRMFALDGARVQNLYGLDLHHEFIELGYELFGDRDLFEGRMVVTDILGDDAKALASLNGKMDIISATAFLHLFTWEEQVRICCRMIGFLKPIAPSPFPSSSSTSPSSQAYSHSQDRQIILGRQSATTHPGIRIRVNPQWGRREIYLHDLESFKKMWAEVGSKTGTKWEDRGELRGLGREGVRGIEEGETARLLIFSVWRLDGCGEGGVGGNGGRGVRGVDRMDQKLKNLRVESFEGELDQERFADDLIEDGAI